MARFYRRVPFAAGLAAIALLILPASGIGSESARTLAPSARNGNTAVFKPPRALAAAIVGGELVVGATHMTLSPGQIRALGRRGGLRVRVPRRSARVVLSLRLESTTGAGGGAGGAGHGTAATIAVGPALVADSPGADPAFDPLSGGRLYSAASPFNQPIPADPAIAPDSASMAQSLVRAEGQKGFVLTVDEWTVPSYFADPSTPLRSISLGGGPPQWGIAAGYPPYPPGSSEGGLPAEMPEQLRGVPIPEGAEADPSSDAHMTILDRAANCEYDLYGAYRTADGWHAAWANSTRLDGSGVYPRGMGTKAAGFANLAGLIWPQELRAGHIDHALFFAYPFTKSGGPVAPATAGDGDSEALGAIPEGARVQLDPSLDLDSLGLRPYQRTIAEAMQTYGMILGDTGGAFGLYAVGRRGFAGNPYQGLLPEEDFPDLSRIPASRFRVLELPPQQAKPPQQLVPSGCGDFG